MNIIKNFIKDHPGITTAIASAAVAAGAYYGVPPGVTESVLKAVFGG